MKKTLEVISLCSKNIQLYASFQSKLLYCDKATPSSEPKILVNNAENNPDLDVFTSTRHTKETCGVIPGKGPPPEMPVYCCMSGCANCVWLEYADELVKYYADGGPKAVQAVKDNVEDANLKSFILLELKMKGIT